MHFCYIHIPWYYLFYYEYLLVGIALLLILGMNDILRNAVLIVALVTILIVMSMIAPYMMISYYSSTFKNNKKARLQEALRLLQENDKALIQLKLNDEGLSREQCTALALALSENTHLTTLELGWNQLHHATGCIQELSNALVVNKTLERLMLGYNHIGNEGCELLLSPLLKGQNTTLTDLDLSSNDIDNVGAFALAQTLVSNKSLQQLDLSSNLIPMEGIQALAKALTQNQTLTSLNLSYTGMGCEGCQALAKALEQNHSMTHLTLESNRIGNRGCQALANALLFQQQKEGRDISNNKTALHYLHLGSNKIGRDGFQAFLQLLENNQSFSLTTLNLKFNYLAYNHIYFHSGGDDHEFHDYDKFSMMEKIEFYLKLNRFGRGSVVLSCGENETQQEQSTVETLVNVVSNNNSDECDTNDNMDVFYSFLLLRPELCDKNLKRAITETGNSNNNNNNNHNKSHLEMGKR